MKRLLKESDKAAVSAAIKQAELRTIGELVTVITGASDEYLYIPTLWASLIALLVPISFVLGGTWMGVMSLFSIQIAVFIVLALVFRIPFIKYALVPTALKRLRASRVAREQFFVQGLQNTEGRTGILLFVSVAERYVEIIADKGINDVAPKEAWNSIVTTFVSSVKAGQYKQGFVSAIGECGEILHQHFPAKKENPNELPDHLVEL